MARDYSGPIYDEIRSLLDKFCSMDPDGEWNDAEWDAYARENASKKLKRYIKRKGKYWFCCEKGEMDGPDGDWDDLCKS